MLQRFSLPREALNVQSKFLKDSRMTVGKKVLNPFKKKFEDFSDLIKEQYFLYL